jgi:predicted P-loop ATPase
MSISQNSVNSIHVDSTIVADTSVSVGSSNNYSSDNEINDSKSRIQATLDQINSNSSENIQPEPETDEFSHWVKSEHDPIHPKHRREWMQGSGISKEITELCLESLDDDSEIAERLGRDWGYDGAHGWWVGSIGVVTGKRTAFGQFKPNVPFPTKKSDKPAKYLTTRNEFDLIALPIRTQEEWQAILDDPSQMVVIPEGAKKAAALETCGYVTLAVAGVWNIRQKGKGLAPNLKAIAVRGRPIVLCYDADMTSKEDVREAMKRSADYLKAAGCNIYVAQWDVSEGKGIDDVLVAQGKDRVDEIMQNFITYGEWLKSQNTENQSKKAKNSQETPQSSHKQKLEQFCATFDGKLRYNEMTLDYEYDGQVIDLEHAQDWLADVLDVGFPYKFEELVRKIKYCAKKQPYHPVKSYLERISVEYHDVDTAILDNLATKYFGTEDALHNIQLRKSLVGAVKRIIDPGCQHDTVCVLQGKQGLQKSKFWETLAISTGWYNSSVASGSSDKDDKMKLRASWLIDLSELEGIFKSKETASLRNLITDKVDSIRPPYGRKIEHFQRMSVFVGTVNPSQFLTDSEGTRRWWIIPVTKQIPIEHLEAERDLIWAAAYKIALRGEKYNSWLSPIEDALREKSNQNHQVEDIWFDYAQQAIIQWDIKQTTASKLLSAAPFNIPVNQQGKREQMRIAEVLKQLGWSKTPNKVMLDGEGYRTYVWSRPELIQEVLEVSPEVSQGVSHEVSHGSNVDTASNTAISDLPDSPFKETFVENNNVVSLDPQVAESKQVIEIGESGKSGESSIPEAVTEQALQNDSPVTNPPDSPLEDQTLQVGNTSLNISCILDDLATGKPVDFSVADNLPVALGNITPEVKDSYRYETPTVNSYAYIRTGNVSGYDMHGEVLDILSNGDIALNVIETHDSKNFPLGVNTYTECSLKRERVKFISAPTESTPCINQPSSDATQKAIEEFLEPCKYEFKQPTAGDSVVMSCGDFEYSGKVVRSKNDNEKVVIKWTSTTDSDKSRLGIEAYSVEELTQGEAVFTKPESAFNPIVVPEVAKMPTATESPEPSFVEIDEDLFESVLNGDDDDYLATFN